MMILICFHTFGQTMSQETAINVFVTKLFPQRGKCSRSQQRLNLVPQVLDATYAHARREKARASATHANKHKVVDNTTNAHAPPARRCAPHGVPSRVICTHTQHKAQPPKRHHGPTPLSVLCLNSSLMRIRQDTEQPN